MRRRAAMVLSVVLLIAGLMLLGCGKKGPPRPPKEPTPPGRSGHVPAPSTLLAQRAEPRLPTAQSPRRGLSPATPVRQGGA